MIVIDLNAKICMAHLLLKPTFHHYSFIEGEVTTFNKFHIDGRIHKDFLMRNQKKNILPGGKCRSIFLQL